MAKTTTAGETGRGPARHRAGFLLWASIPLACTTAAWSGASSVGPGLETVSQVIGSAATWLSSDGPLVATGAGRQWAISRRDGSPVTSGEFDAPARRAVLVRGTLYFDQGDRIAVLTPGSTDPSGTIDLEVREGADLLVGRVHDYLFVVEQGRGVHLLAIPPPPGFQSLTGHPYRHVWPDRPVEVSFVPLERLVVALASFGRTVYLALEHDGVAVVDTDDPLVPRLDTVLPIPDPVTALAVNGYRLFVLGGGVLSTYDLRTEPPRLVRRFEGVSGTSMELSGRLILVARGAEGLTTFRDESLAAVTHFVTLTNFAFTPRDITIEVGDTVQWDNTLGTHDADSCESGQTGCAGASTEVFDSGAPLGAPWTFSHTFTKVGANPYSCTVHGGIGMVGSVQVDAASVPPPAVPDGTGPSNPLRVAKLDSTGASLEIAFDDVTCAGAVDTQIVGGFGSDLPAPGGPYGIAFSRCGCGTTSPCAWNPSPQPASGQLVWFVMTATDGATTEGPWGRDGVGNERSGPGAGGASGQCGVTGRDLTNTCGH